MFQRLLMTAVIAFVSQGAFAGPAFPTSPDLRLTPGSYCQRPDAYRYPERIAYCNRNVDRDEKVNVIRDYNQRLGYRIDLRDRQQYKIDHLIPLCAGGSNKPDNLWPQHESVYRLTDPIEGLACEKMAAGRLTQKRAVELIFQAKFHLDQVNQVMATLRSL
jgi:hypothetical protein